MQQPVDYYKQSIQRCNSLIDDLKTKIFRTAMGRLATFVVIILAIYYFENVFTLAVIVTCIILFFYLLKLTTNLKAKKDLTEKLLFINKNEVAMMNGKSNEFDDGTSLPENSIYSTDLDIVGHNSLYHFLNRTVTSHGAHRLDELLNDPLNNVAGINEHQQAVKQLSSQPEIRQLITARALLRDGNAGSIEEIKGWIGSPGKLASNKTINIIRFILPLINLAAFFIYLDSDNTLPLITGITISWIVIGIYSQYVHKQHSLIGKKQNILDQYAFILDQFHQSQPGDSALLEKLHQTASAGKHEVKRLSRLTGFFDQRLNLIVNIFLNSFFLYDIHIAIALEKWKLENKDRFNEWIDAVGTIEMINSLATYAYNNPAFCFPEVSEGKPFIRAENVSHPLIDPHESVANDITLGIDEKLMLITGSNMSGKSTFLRTVGTNLLLAYCGAPVSAKSFSCSPMTILSSIRINDSLQEHTSYFMAELKRLKQIITILQSGKPALVLIDEVLRGTNSNDKTHGSEALIKKLITFDCISLFATHDLTLSELEKQYPAEISNGCFESTIVNGELLFDYKLREGVAMNKNATFLMEKMGIISA